jgi:hypothetical protein
VRSPDRPLVWFFRGLLVSAPVAWLISCCRRAPRRRIPDRVTPSRLASELGTRLVGTAADGRALDSPVTGPFVWVSDGDEILVYPASLQTRVVGDVLLVSIDLETDQTGRSPVVCAFALARDPEGGGLLATTDEVPFGDPLLVGRWGRVVQDALWASLMALAADHSAERGASPAGLFLRAGRLEFAARRTA